MHLLALGGTKCKFVCSRSLKSERPSSSCALLSPHVFCNFRPPPAGISCDAGMAGWELSKLPAASHASCLAVTRRDGRHSTQLVRSTLMLGRERKKTRKKSRFYFAPVCHLPISLEVKEWRQLMTVGRRRHRHWHRRSMFQASGGIMWIPRLCQS